MGRSPTADSLRAGGLCKSFAEREVVTGVDLDVRPGEIVGLLGPSGSGKSTIFNMLAGVVRPDAGAVVLDKRDVTGAGIDVRARLGLGYVPQSPALFPHLTAQDNLKIAIEASGMAASMEAFLATLCRAFSLEEARGTRLANLSGGQRRRVEIAIALCSRPRFLLLDEPFAGLDPIVSDQLAALVARLARLGMGIIVTDHNVRYALKLVQRAYVIDDGRIIAAGSATDIVGSRQVRQRFLGMDFRF